MPDWQPEVVEKAVLETLETLSGFEDMIKECHFKLTNDLFGRYYSMQLTSCTTLLWYPKRKPRLCFDFFNWVQHVTLPCKREVFPEFLKYLPVHLRAERLYTTLWDNRIAEGIVAIGMPSLSEDRFVFTLCVHVKKISLYFEFYSDRIVFQEELGGEVVQKKCLAVDSLKEDELFKLVVDSYYLQSI